MVSPAHARERRLRDMLACAETVIGCAARKRTRSKGFMNTAAEVVFEVRAGLAGSFVDGEVGRLRKTGCHATQPEAVRAISLEFHRVHWVTVARGSGRPRR